MTKFSNLALLVNSDTENRISDLSFYIKHGYLLKWADEHKQENDTGIQQYSTELKWKQYQNGILDREKAVGFALSRMIKQLDKDSEKKLEKIERIENAPDLEYVTIHVEWKRSSVWGYNPHAMVTTNTGVYMGTASGYGYDKESAAVAAALNQCPAVLKALYTLKNDRLKEGWTDADNGTCTGHNNRHICGYGAGYSVLPAFEGGVGVSCFWEIFKTCGYTFRHMYSGKRVDWYRIERKEADET